MELDIDNLEHYLFTTVLKTVNLRNLSINMSEDIGLVKECRDKLLEQLNDLKGYTVTEGE